MLKDLQFLAAAGEGDAKQHNSVLALIRSYLCLLKAEQQVQTDLIRHLMHARGLPTTKTHSAQGVFTDKSRYHKEAILIRSST